jgi:hypothetical protein
MAIPMQPNQPVEKLAYNKSEACAALGGISVTTLWRFEKRGLLKPIPGIRHKLYPVAALRRFVEGGAA